MRIVEMACLAVLASPIGAQVAPPPPPAIVTNAEAQASVQADRAQILIAVETRGPTAAAAASENARITRATLDTLRAAGLSREQLSTFGYSVQPQYNQKVLGYLAHNTVRVDIRKLDDVGRMIDAALAGGATTIGSLQFTASNTDSARREAFARATAQARGDAEAVARAAGGALGPLLEVTASGDNGIRPIMYARAATMSAAAPTPIDAGPITIQVNVSTRWQFVPANR